jgi:PTH2 family peptidyl-tRNA hydrolase|tara:strand:+ start:182 stop:535 length:354 start_codon:yes stop_codon:yes gene_type:complete
MVKMGYKQVILVRQDLKLPKGKLAVQVAHASLDAASKSDKKIVDKWKKQGAKKIVLKAADEKELFKYMSMLENEGIKVALIKDAGHTVVEPGTITCLGIGPDLDDKIDKVTGKLKMV